MEQVTSFIENLSTTDIMNIVISLVVVIVFNIFLSPSISFLILKLFNIKKSKKEIKEGTFYGPLNVFLKMTAIYITILFLRPILGLADSVTDLITKTYKIIVTITIAHSFANSITRKSKVIETIKDKSEKDINDGTTRILVRLIKAIIYIVAAFIVIAEIGYDLSGLITGLGLGSVVLTLAAQNTIKDLIGGMLIAFDKPFRTGDYIKCNDFAGTVEDITFRCTRLRTVDETVVSIPNSTITSEEIENYSRLKKRRYLLDLELSMDTSIEKINQLEGKIHGLLMSNEYVYKDTINIHFTGMSSSGYKMSIICYFDIIGYMEFLDLKEELNKDILSILDNLHIQLAYDTKTIELKK